MLRTLGVAVVGFGWMGRVHTRASAPGRPPTHPRTQTPRGGAGS
ncbi:hypothetical protein ACFV5G_00675, partial [Streptomyces sp. NPDC059766]